MDSRAPVIVEILVYAPTMFFHCRHCEFVWQQTPGTPNFRDEQLESSIPDDLMQEYHRLSDWALSTAEEFRGRVIFKVIDAASIEGALKSLRYWVRKFPAMIVDGREKIIGLDFDRARDVIEKRLGDRGHAAWH